MSIDKSGALHVSVVRTMKPCEDCGRSPALQYTLVGMTGVLCRECLNKVVADINQALAATSEQDVSEQVSFMAFFFFLLAHFTFFPAHEIRFHEIPMGKMYI
jgi:hypothetical protein